MKTVIVGGVAGGASAAARLRRLDEKAEIVLFERGEFISFANCGLPYYIGGAITEESKLTLQTPASFRARFNIDVRIKNEVTAVNPAQKTVTVLNHVTGETYEESYDKLILSPGAEPIRPPFARTDDPRIFTLRNIPDTMKIKNYMRDHEVKRAAVIGGGYIGMEMAENLAEAGADVTVVEMADHVIAPLDGDMAAEVHVYARKKGIHLKLRNGVKDLKAETDALTVVLEQGEVSADMVVLSIGVKPEGSLAKDAGLFVNQRGCIAVNEHMQTSDPDIYAVGDAVEVVNFVTGQKAFTPLAGPANKQGRIAADHICGLDSAYQGTQGSAILKFFDMTVATTGVNEKTAKEAGLDYDKTYTYSASHAGYYPGGTSMSVKTIFEKKTGKILGCQIVGYDGVDKRCDMMAAAVRLGLTAKQLTELELCYAPPFSSAKDPVNFVGYVIENILTGKVKQYFWEDLDQLMGREDVFLLDVRTKAEYEADHIDGFVHIPLDSLREKLSEIPKEKKLYVHCRSGLRSYIACRILTGSGYDCYNISGGYRMYEIMMKDKEETAACCENPCRSV